VSVDLASVPFRRTGLGPRAVDVRRNADGTVYLAAQDRLLDYPRAFTECLVRWAGHAPDRTFLAKRVDGGDWRRLSYAQVLGAVRAIGQALIDRGVSADRPIVVLSGNDLEHALIALAAIHIGAPFAPISPAYALVSTDYGKLKHVLGLLTPGLVYAAEGKAFDRAIAACVPADTEVVLGRGALDSRAATPFDALAATTPTDAVDRAHAAITGDTVAKILFTSGSTAQPKGVIQTHRMLCSNQQMYVQGFPLYAEQPPLVLVDWQPWHHTAGGNANFGVALYNGGTLYIDEGKPVAGAIEETVRNLREIAPSIYISVPKGFEALLPYLEREQPLRERFFSGLRMLWYAGAGMSQHIWDALQRLSAESFGERTLVMTGLGATETGPYAFGANWDAKRSGIIGLPAAGCEAKLVPNGEKLEVRVRGPNITPGYWRQPELTQAAFDEEGFYCMGDAVKWVDEHDPGRGLEFDGRIAEDFKLDTGTWVSVGALRVQVIAGGAPYIQDVVVCGHDRGELGVLVYPNLPACRALASDLPVDAPATAVVAHPAVRKQFADMLAALAQASTGSSNRVARAILLDTPPSLDAGEMTDKGSISQRTALKVRAKEVEALYAAPDSAGVIRAGRRT
jgi:feruloyl-CoA synthase